MTRPLRTTLFAVLLALGAAAFAADRIYQTIDRGFIYSADTVAAQAVSVPLETHVLPAARGGQETLFE